MFPSKIRIITLLNSVINETALLQEMSMDINTPDDFVTSMSGMVVFRACGMSLQFSTENLVKIRNLCGMDFFKSYKEVPWNSVFGMRNFLAHEYGNVDTEGIFNTVKTHIPVLHEVAVRMLADIQTGKLDQFFSEQ